MPSTDRAAQPVPAGVDPDDWPPRFYCHVPGLFKSLAAEGYGLVLAPLAGNLNVIAERAIELDDPKLLAILRRMGLLEEVT